MLRVGLLGCGNISGIYLENSHKLFSKQFKIVMVYDLVSERAKLASEKLGGAKIASSIDELLTSKEVDAILNLSQPLQHHKISLLALQAGKIVHSEKPLGVNLHEGKELLDTANAKKLRYGCAPDTFLGAGIQTAKKIIDDGLLGKITGGHAFMLCGGHEGWHPDPAFYYRVGGGPMLDMGPYYVTALLALLGPVAAVTALSSKAYTQRVVGSEPKRGEVMPVEVNTHVNGLMHFASGADISLTTSFDVPVPPDYPCIAIYGSEASMLVPDPNAFGGPVRVKTKADKEWNSIPLLPGFPENSRGLGLADIAVAIEESRAHCASIELAYHALEIMESFELSQQKKSFAEIQSRFNHGLKLTWK